MHTLELRATVASQGLFSESPIVLGLIERDDNWPEEPKSACPDLAEDCCVMERLFSHWENKCRLPFVVSVYDRRTGCEMATVEQL